MPKMTHERLKKKAFKKPGVKKAYDSLKDEFGLLEEMMHASLKAKENAKRNSKGNENNCIHFWPSRDRW